MNEKSLRHQQSIKDKTSCEGIAVNIFTLIELLVVIAIIAILASMLLPAITNAKKMANSAVCQNSLKYLGSCLMYYADDYNEYIPPYRDFSRSGEWTWVNCVDLYFPKPTSELDPQQQKWKCPEYKGNSRYSYAENAYIEYCRLGAVVYPSTGFLLTESADVGTYPRITGNAYMTEMGFRHLNKANMVFWDFHVGPVKTSDIPDWNTRYQPTWEHFWRPWNR